MVFDLTLGDVVRIGDGLTLTVLAVEDDLIRFGLESPEACPGAVGDGEGAEPKPRRRSGSAGRGGRGRRTRPHTRRRRGP
jgi:hypothetical protein